MSFTDEAIEQFKKAGWSPGRNVESDYLSKPGFLQCPTFLRSFLSEYGNLIVEGIKEYETEVITSFETNPDDFQEYFDSLQKSSYPSEKPLFPVGAWEPDPYLVTCDEDGKIFLFGIETVFFSETFEEGIERILRDRWDGILVFNEDSRKWEKPAPLKEQY